MQKLNFIKQTTHLFSLNGTFIFAYESQIYTIIHRENRTIFGKQKTKEKKRKHFIFLGNVEQHSVALALFCQTSIHVLKRNH